MSDASQATTKPVPDNANGGTIRLSDTVGEALGTSIGKYKLLEKIGEGGFGTVYVAEQNEPVRRRVALKIIKLGMDTEEIVARFEVERQALALMEHPYRIAKVFDAGATATGRPYFVMELVRGIRITDYCDQHQLSTAGRLKLFMQVCHAVQHAHQKGIIHRDIKPSNILVALTDSTPTPKVIDFGIAKAVQQKLGEKSVYTQLHQFIGTPAYMSPEQAEMSGLGIDTRSDIYSLGVLLYELLTGRTPFDGKRLVQAGLDEIRRIIREEEPPRPSTRLSTLAQGELVTTARHHGCEPAKLSGRLRGDLDWIVMKCLEKDRTRRYETTNELADDVQRHLTNEPVNAAAPSVSYRLRKFVRRRRGAVTALAAIFLLLVVAASVSLARHPSQTRGRDGPGGGLQNQLLAEIFGGAFGDMSAVMVQGPQGTVLRRRMDEAVETLDKNPALPPLAVAYVKSVLGDTYFSIGDYARAEVQQAQSLELRTKALPKDDTLIAVSQRLLARTQKARGDWEGAERLYGSALAIFTKRYGHEHPEISLTKRETDAMRLIGKAAQAGSTSAGRGQSKSIPARDSRARKGQVDLSNFYNASLSEAWGTRSSPSNDLRNLPQGLQMFAGVEFDVRGVLQLSSNAKGIVSEFPRQIEGMKLGTRAQRLHFLHATRRLTGEGMEIGRYVIRYSDQATNDVPIVYGKHVRNWWIEGLESTNTPGSNIAWLGTNPEAEKLKAQLRLFKTMWINPRPEVPIATIDFVSDMTDSAPFLIAITAE